MLIETMTGTMKTMAVANGRDQMRLLPTYTTSGVGGLRAHIRRGTQRPAAIVA